MYVAGRGVGKPGITLIRTNSLPVTDVSEMEPLSHTLTHYMFEEVTKHTPLHKIINHLMQFATNSVDTQYTH